MDMAPVIISATALKPRNNADVVVSIRLRAGKFASPRGDNTKEIQTMLEDSLIETRQKPRNPFTVIVSVIAHVMTVASLVLIPLLQTQALTIPPVDMSLFLPRVEPRSNVTVFTERPSLQRQHPSKHAAIFTAPAVVPPQIAYNIDEPPALDVPFSMPGSNRLISSTGIPEGGVFTVPIPVVTPPGPPPPPPPPDNKIVRIRQHSSIQTANLIHQVQPIYPPIARQTRTQGVVLLEAVIDKDGSIQTLRVISGHPLLTSAALDAVKQWKYRPTLLNGEPIEVITTVTVTFTLR
jgi:protein TonB